MRDVGASAPSPIGRPDLGNVEAAEKGPTSYGKRVVRRKVYRKVDGSLWWALWGFRF